MKQLHTFAIEIDSILPSSIKYSICTLMSNPEEYAEMMQSFINAGFETSFCEYLYIDNSQQNKYDAYAGLNKFLTLAKGTYIVICHQDILVNYDRIDVLEQRISEMDILDNNWAVLGNAGAGGIKNIVYKLTNQLGELYSRGSVPQQVLSLDENFLLIKKAANLSFSKNLCGFHFYGTDICLIAKVLGYTTYVFDFNIIHKSEGKVDPSFERIKNDLIQKYITAFDGRYIQTTMTNFYISGSRFENFFFELKVVRFFARQYFKFKFRKLRE